MNAAPAPAPELVLRSALDVYSHVDDLGPLAAGELCVTSDDGARGAVFIERGRICWAAAHGLAPRLTQLLALRASIPPRDMEAIFRSCKANRTPLGEHLLAIGALRPEDLRAALMQHTVESLRRLCSAPGRAVWSTHSRNGYCPAFTFTTAELLAHTGAERHPELAASIAPFLARMFDDASWAAAFTRSRDLAHPEPIAIFGSGISQAKPLLRMGKWAASVLDVVAAFNDEHALIAIEHGAGSLVALREGDAIVVAETGAHGPARILNRRARERKGGRDADL